MGNIFYNLNVFKVFSGLCAFLGLGFALLGYLSKRKSNILFLQSFCCLFEAFSFLFLGRFYGFLATIIALIRTIIFWHYENKGQNPPAFLTVLIIIVLFFSVSIPKFQVINLVYFIGVTLLTVAFLFKDVLKTKLVVFIGLLFYILYSFLTNNYVNAVGLIIQAFVAYIGYSSLKKYNSLN